MSDLYYPHGSLTVQFCIHNMNLSVPSKLSLVKKSTFHWWPCIVSVQPLQWAGQSKKNSLKKDNTLAWQESDVGRKNTHGWNECVFLLMLSLSLLWLPSPFFPCFHKRHDQSRALLVLGLTSHPTLPNLSTPHFSSAAGLNKRAQLAHLTHARVTGWRVNIVPDLTFYQREERAVMNGLKVKICTSVYHLSWHIFVMHVLLMKYVQCLKTSLCVPDFSFFLFFLKYAVV